METNKTFKVGDYVMIDGGGVANCQYAKIKEVSDNMVKLSNVYRRKRVNTYSGDADVLSFDLVELYYNGGDFKNFYHITKSEYDKIVDAYMEYSRLLEKMSEVYRKPYFECKKR